MTAPDSPHADGRRFHVVVPVKPLDRAKSRLRDLGDELRRDLAVAFLLDVLAAVAGSSAVARIVVVTDDDRVRARVREHFNGRVEVAPDTEPIELNRALRHGAASLDLPVGSANRTGLLALCADLPALTVEAVSALLACAPPTGSGFVADHTGVGTTAYVAAAVGSFQPRFGARSREAHARQGALDLTALASPELRADVDTPADLEALHGRLGVETGKVLARHRS